MSALSKFSKKLRWSKTLWVNLLTGTASVLATVGGISVLPPSVAPYLVAWLAVVNILLRLITNKPISGV